MDEKPNIIFVAIDALRAANLGCYGYTKDVSPNIDRLAANGLLFENAYACINFTDPSFTTIFSGKYPLSHGILNHGARVTNIEVREFETRNIQLLPEILRASGYNTLAIDWLWRWHKRGYNYYSGAGPQSTLHGFIKQQVRKFPVIRRVVSQSAVNKVGEKIFKVSKSYEDAKNVTDQAIELLKENRNQRFFLFLHYWDPHSPYLPPREYVRDFITTQKKIRELFRRFINVRFKEQFQSFVEKATQYQMEIVASYDGEISFADHEIGRLLEFLRRQDMLDDTLIVLTSDHGESLFEHGIYLDHHGLYDETVHVPFILVHPQLPRGKRIQGFVQHFDIVPTILDLLDVQTDIDFDGMSVLSLVNGKQLHSAVYFEEAQWSRKRAIRTEEWKYIHALSEEDAVCRRCGLIHGGVQELYHLTTDPKEIKNVIGTYPEIVAQLGEQLEQWTKRFDHKRQPGREAGDSYKDDMEKVEQRLRDLGYI